MVHTLLGGFENRDAGDIMFTGLSGAQDPWCHENIKFKPISYIPDRRCVGEGSFRSEGSRFFAWIVCATRDLTKAGRGGMEGLCESKT
jgi:hypothetical protein